MKQIILAVFLATILGGCAVGSIKEPSYSVVQKDGDIEIRHYDPMIVAEVTMTGDRKEAINNGFRALADYIFGNNDGEAKIAMTAPVTQQADKGAKIEMTAPVTQQSSGVENTWKVHFVMPADYTMANIPKPKNPAITLIERAPYDAAVLRFSGWAGNDTLADKTKELESWMAVKNMAGTEKPVYAFYNPPWTLPFLRRNEIMMTLAPKP